MNRSALVTRPQSLEIHAAPRSHLPFRKIVVLGAGTMGAQIAAHLGNAGASVVLLDLPSEGENRNALAEAGLERARRLKPKPFFTDEVASRILTGNFEDDRERLADADWVIEAVVERADVKREVLDFVESNVRDDAVISTNTSGIPIRDLAAGRGPEFVARFLGTHFYNPPRYLRLLEIIPTAETSEDVVDRVSRFARIHLGKGIVVAHDTPYFIGNRIGVYGMLSAMRHFTDGEYSVEEIDQLTGPMVGRPSSGTFRTADVVGLDVLLDVADNLYEALLGDERRDAFRAPDLLRRLVADGRLGAKTGSGFYRKDGGEIRSVSRNGDAYGKGETSSEVDSLQREADPGARLRALYGHNGRAGRFFRQTTLDLLSYAACRIPEITEHPADVDRALRWGFGWELGPFQIWDAIGFERVIHDIEEQGMRLPEWISEMRKASASGFYHTRRGRTDAYLPSKKMYLDQRTPQDELGLAEARVDARNLLWEGRDAALVDVGECVALFEFRSKANALTAGLMRGMMEAVELVELHPDLRGLVIGNEGRHFSVGANLNEIAAAIDEAKFDEVEAFLREFQEAVQRIHYASKPVVAAVHGMVLGGGCEVMMGCRHPVAAAESYVGLVELGVGLIPAGTGTMRLAVLASERTFVSHASNLQSNLQRLFEQVARGEVSGSAAEAMKFGYLPSWTRIVMNAERRLYVAREEVIRLSNQGYQPPPPGRRVRVLGTPTRAALEISVEQFRLGGFISDYDAHLANQLAFVITGGGLSSPQDVDENYLLDLEREIFLQLAGEPRTQQRIEHMLRTRKPLRN